MKKINLFKVVMSTLLAVLVLTWVIPASMYDGATVSKTEITVVPLIDLFSNMINTTSYFSQIAVFIIVVGGFYGILNITDTYNVIVSKIAKYFKGKEKKLIVASILTFEILAAFVSLPLVLFTFVPMVISIILILGYNKTTALLATIGAISIGFIGSIYSHTLYSGIVNSTTELTATTDIFAKIALLVLGAVLLIMFTFKGMKKVTSKNKEEIKDPFYLEVKKTNSKLLPMKIFLGSIFVLLILGFVDWKGLFEITFFENLYTDFMNLTLFDFPIMANIFGSLAKFGQWSYIDLSIVLAVTTIILAFMYKIKINEYLISLFDGINKMLPTAGLFILAFSVLVLSNSTSTNELIGIVPAFFDFFAGFTNNLNVIIMSVPTILSGIINVDYYYYVQFGFPIAKSLVSDSAVDTILVLFFQTMYGFTTLFAPTSLILLAGLSYLEVSYIEWIKHIFKLLLQLFVVIMAILIILMLI